MERATILNDTPDTTKVETIRKLYEINLALNDVPRISQEEFDSGEINNYDEARIRKLIGNIQTKIYNLLILK